MKIIKIMFYPFYFLILIPIELPLWKEMKRQNYNVPNYFKFVYERIGPDFISYKHN